MLNYFPATPSSRDLPTARKTKYSFESHFKMTCLTIASILFVKVIIEGVEIVSRYEPIGLGFVFSGVMGLIFAVSEAFNKIK